MSPHWTDRVWAWFGTHPTVIVVTALLACTWFLANKIDRRR